MPEFDFLFKNKGVSIKIPSDFGIDKSTLILVEKSNNNDGEIKILNVPSDSLLIKIDEDKFDVRQIFSSIGAKGICSKADYILISKEKKKIILCG